MLGWYAYQICYYDRHIRPHIKKYKVDIKLICTPLPAGIRNRHIGIIHCNLTDKYCFHEISSFTLHTCITLDAYTLLK